MLSSCLLYRGVYSSGFASPGLGKFFKVQIFREAFQNKKGKEEEEKRKREGKGRKKKEEGSEERKREERRKKFK